MGEGITVKLMLCFAIFGFVLFLVSPSILAQNDSDGDGVIDDADNCPNTNVAEDLPIISQNKEYLGCSCSQILEGLKDYTCYDISCFPNRQFSIRERQYSSQMTVCENDYCIDSTLYKFPKIYPRCVDGEREEVGCAPEITENSLECIRGTIAQFQDESVEIAQDLTGAVFLNDFEKLQRRAFTLSTSDPRIKSVLGISNEEIFLDQTQKTMNRVNFEKSIKTEVKTIGTSTRTITTVTITMNEENFVKAKNLYIFEELPNNLNLGKNDVIPLSDVVLQEINPQLLVFQIDNPDGTFEVSYQINRPFNEETNTLLIAKNIKNTSWQLLIIPLALIIIIIFVFFSMHEKSVPKRNKIFKE